MVEASLDTWTSIFLLASVHGLFLAFGLFFTEKGVKEGRILLGSLMISFSLVLAYYVSFWTGYNKIYPQIEGYTNAIPFLFGPFIYLYFNSLVGVKLSKTSLIHFLPFLIYTLYLFPFIFLSGAQKAEIITNSANIDLWRIWAGRVFTWGQVFQMIIYGVLLLPLSRKISVSQDLPYLISRRAWLQKLAILFLIFSLVHCSYYVMVILGKYELTIDYLMSFSMALIIYYVGYSGFRVPLTLTNALEKSRERTSNLTPLATQAFLSKLKSYMDEKKPFLDGDLKLPGLAEKIGLKSHDLSQLINDQFEHNFSDFINGYRIRDAEKLLLNSEDEDIRVIEIAYQCGFNTKAAFYNAFKKKNGMSPLSFRKTYLRSFKGSTAVEGVLA